jgi:hypothetical protein
LDATEKQSISIMALKKFLQYFNFLNNFLLAFDYWQWLYITAWIIKIIFSSFKVGLRITLVA